MIESIKKHLKQVIENQLNIETVVIEDAKKGNADLAIPLFAFAKEWKISPLDVSKRFMEALANQPLIDHLEFLNGFLNIYLERKNLAKSILNAIAKEGSSFGDQKVGLGETVVMDYSSPNIAKSFGVGHLRSTMIGNSIKNIYKKLGYQVVAVNHLGDWGTQFGKMIVSYQKWGNEELVKSNPIQELQKLYVQFHDEEKNDPTLEQQARDVFRALEQNDPEYTRL
ncbi:MAG: arginine--tRNA ligase, partial [Tenericutes bacterium GWA2_38_26]